MICYQTRYEDGVFIGTAQAHEDPIEKGRMVLPGGCVAVPPPAFAAGEQARWAGGSWVIEKATAVVTTSDADGLAISWSGDDLIITRVPCPALQKGQAAAFDGVRWNVTDPPSLISKIGAALGLTSGA